MQRVNVFQVPEGYFENLSERMLTSIVNMAPDDFESVKANVHEVPDGYFENLSNNILAKIRELYPLTVTEEISGISPLLSSLRGKNTFTVPEGYFESFAGSVQRELVPVGGKIITMKPRRTWLQIAAAAVVTGVIAFSSLQIFNDKSDNTQIQIASNHSSTIPDYIKKSFQFKTEGQIDAGIARLSEEDIIQYLKSNGNVMDNELLVRNTDLSELPSETDYLKDENALNSYLNSLDKGGSSN